MSLKPSGCEGLLKSPSTRKILDRSGARVVDAAAALLGLVLLSPCLLALALLVKTTGKGPALFRSTRIGRNGRPFTLFKLRSMREDAPTAGPAITASEDPRITPVGRFMRSHKLDELPQLLNVLKGDMSLVGPRPEDPTYVALYSREQLSILDAKPGITSPASLLYSDEGSELVGEDWELHYVNDVMPAKLFMDGDYLRTRTLASDLKIVWATLVKLTGATGRAGGNG